MQIRYLLIALLFFCVGQISAQRNNKDERAIVYMADGSKFIGTINKKSKTAIILEIYNGNVIEIDLDDTDAVLSKPNYLVYAEGKYHDTKGIFFGRNIGLSIVELDEENAIFSFHGEAYAGWRFNKKWSLAGGLGIEVNQNQIGGINFTTEFVSPFVMGKYYINDHRYRVYSYARAGYGFSLFNTNFGTGHTDGEQFQIGAGLALPSSTRFKLNVSAGYHFQRTTGTDIFIDDFGNEVMAEFDLNINRLMVKFGIEFY